MSTTEIMRRMLEERGVDYRSSATGYSVDIGPYTTVYANRSDTTLDVSLRNVTPEQAIAAALGRGECKPMTYDNGYLMDRVEPGEYYEFWEPACACSECGELIPMRRFCPNCGAKIVAPTTNDVDAEVAR